MAAERVLVLTPVKQAAAGLDRYFRCLRGLDHPPELLSLGFLESDSTDGTYEQLERRLGALRERYRRVVLEKHDYGFAVPAGVARWAPPMQLPRRSVLAKSRNRLLSGALADEDWVLWIDVDLVEYPGDVLARMLATGKDIVTPHCVKEYGGATFDWNAWRDKGETRMDDLRGGPDLVRLDAVGGTMLLIRADLHREGLVFPPFLYGADNPAARDTSPWVRDRRGEIETEGLGLMAKDMGFECWGMPNLEILHANE